MHLTQDSMWRWTCHSTPMLSVLKESPPAGIMVRMQRCLPTTSSYGIQGTKCLHQDLLMSIIQWPQTSQSIWCNERWLVQGCWGLTTSLRTTGHGRHLSSLQLESESVSTRRAGPALKMAWTTISSSSKKDQSSLHPWPSSSSQHGVATFGGMFRGTRNHWACTVKEGWGLSKGGKQREPMSKS